MSNPLYMALGIGEYDLLEVHEDQNELLVLIGWRRETWRCPTVAALRCMGMVARLDSGAQLRLV